MKIIFPLISILVAFSCGSTTNKTNSSIAKEIEQLSTEELKTTYLEQILVQDQKVRTDETTVLKQYGHDSKEHKAAWDVIREMDALNLQKIELYLATYGYPKKEYQSSKAITAPWMVLHHQPNNGARRSNFQYLFEAYKKGDLDGGSLAFFLNRLYRQEFGHRLELESPFREEFEIDTLLKALDLGDH